MGVKMPPSEGEADVLHDLLSILKGFRNGLVYGVKIRLPHAFVMTFLFQQGTLDEKLRWIFWATKKHAWNLGRFTAIYKATSILLKYLEGHKSSWHSFVAGCLGGYLIFSEENSVNNQIILYLMARVISGLVQLAYSKLKMYESPMLAEVAKNSFAIKSTLCWGLVMWLFQNHRRTLQSSLQSSMQYLYLDSDHWAGLYDFIFLNKKAD